MEGAQPPAELTIEPDPDLLPPGSGTIDLDVPPPPKKRRRGRYTATGTVLGVV